MLRTYILALLIAAITPDERFREDCIRIPDDRKSALEDYTYIDCTR